MDKRYKVKIVLEIVNQDDDSPFFISTNAYEQMPMSAVLKVERELVGVLGNMVTFGEQTTQDRLKVA